jgi:hypothetical protein
VAEEPRLIASGRNDPDESRRVLASAKELRGALDGVLRAKQVPSDNLLSTAELESHDHTFRARPFDAAET